MDRDQLRIVGLTGVEMTLDIAGVGSRSYAFIIDWHIRLLVALAWLLVAVLLGNAHLIQLAPRNPLTAFLAWVPAVCIYFFYHPVLEMALRGRTPGKRIAGVRLVTRNGGTPSIAALFVRNLFRLIDSMPFVYVVGLVTCLCSAQRVRIGDMAAGTLLILDEPSSAGSLARIGSLVAHTGLPPEVVELVQDLLGRWDALDSERRRLVARKILERVDTTLLPDALASATDEELRSRLQTLMAARR